MINVSLALTPVSARPRLAAMMLSYLCELYSAAGNADAVTGPTQPDPYFDLYWSDADRWPFFILTNGFEAGFALVRKVGNHPENLFEIAEFFVIPSSRRFGVGTTAAQLLFDRLPGAWQVFQLSNHWAATAFWRTAIDGYTQGEYSEETMPDERHEYRQYFQSDHDLERPTP